MRSPTAALVSSLVFFRYESKPRDWHAKHAGVRPGRMKHGVRFELHLHLPGGRGFQIPTHGLPAFGVEHMLADGPAIEADGKLGVADLAEEVGRDVHHHFEPARTRRAVQPGCGDRLRPAKA